MDRSTDAGLGDEGAPGLAVRIPCLTDLASATSVEELYRLSGMSFRLNDFRARVRAALKELAVDGVPVAFKVSGHLESEGSDSINVKLAKWG